MDQQAQELNSTIQEANPSVWRLLSSAGVELFFPKAGIIGQSTEARAARINATIGIALDDEGAPLCFEAISRRVALDPREVFPYAHPLGRPDVRCAWAAALQQKNPSLKGKAISEPIVTAALTHGLSMAGYLFVNRGDTIISPDQYWDNYPLVFGNAYGAALSTFTTFTPQEVFNVEGLRATLDAGGVGKKVVLLNFPNNPTGYTVTEQEAQQLCTVLLERAHQGDDLLVLCDDAYFGLVYEPGVLTQSLFALLADLHEKILAVKLDGPTKEDYVWGLRVGFMTFGVRGGTRELYNALEMKLAGGIRGNISNVSNVGQSLLAHAWADRSYEGEKKRAFLMLKRRYELVRKTLDAHPEYREYFEPLPFNSGYFMCVRLREGLDANTVRKRALSAYDTGVIAQGPLLRVAFSSTPLSQLEEVFDHLYKAARDVAGAGV